jgi:hypothetical protein
MSPHVRIPANDAVAWNGTRYGLLPTLREDAGRWEAQGEAAIPVLLETLDDPDRFVTAHVLLTRISAIVHETFPTWNGLEVEIAADGSVRIDPAGRPALAERWNRWYRSDPRPDRLPG